MASPTNEITDALGHLMDVQAEQGRILTELEQRPIPDMAGLARRLEEVADTLTRGTGEPELESTYYGANWSAAFVLLLGGMLAGMILAWALVQYLPTPWLPPGFHRPVVAPQKGRF